MDRFELMERLSEESGTYIHINFTDRNKTYTEEEYQEIKKSISELVEQTREKRNEKLLRSNNKRHSECD